MAHFNKRLAQTLSGSHLVDGHSSGSSGAVAAIDIRGPRRVSSASARRDAALDARRNEMTQVAADPYAQTYQQAEEAPPSSAPSAPYSSGELPIAMSSQMSAQAYAHQTQHPVAVHAQMTPEAYAAYVHAVQIANQQQAQLAQLAQMQMAAQHIAATQPAQARPATSARAAVEDTEDNSREGRVKFLLFGLALGALVVILISGNTWSNLRTRLAYALMPTPAATVAPVAAPMPVDTSSSTKIPQYEVGRLPPAAPAPPPVVAAAPAPAPVAAPPKVVVAAAPKKQPMPTQIHVPAPPAAEEPATANDPAPPVPPGLDTALNMKAFGELGKAFKAE
jgi:hypothetical protein